MAFAKTRVGTRLYYEEAGSGTPILFLHEFAGDYRSWEAQVRHFSRRHRCVTYSARGYLTSRFRRQPIPQFSTFHERLTACWINWDSARASSAVAMATPHCGWSRTGSALSDLANTGSLGAGDKKNPAAPSKRPQFETLGAAGWHNLRARWRCRSVGVRAVIASSRNTGQHDAHGSHHAGFQVDGRRSRFSQPASPAVPTLIVVGDQDDACIEPSLFLKKMMRPGARRVPEDRHAIT